MEHNSKIVILRCHKTQPLYNIGTTLY